MPNHCGYTFIPFNPRLMLTAAAVALFGHK